MKAYCETFNAYFFDGLFLIHGSNVAPEADGIAKSLLMSFHNYTGCWGRTVLPETISHKTVNIFGSFLFSTLLFFFFKFNMQFSFFNKIIFWLCQVSCSCYGKYEGLACSMPLSTLTLHHENGQYSMGLFCF